MFLDKDSISESVFRDIVVPLYPKDKPISEMTIYEQNEYRRIKQIVEATLNYASLPRIDVRNNGIPRMVMKDCSKGEHFWVTNEKGDLTWCMMCAKLKEK